MKHIAFDLGGSGGKMALGELKNGKLSFQEIYRFPNRQISLRGDLMWDVLGIYQHLLEGIRLACQQEQDVCSVGMDSFCNDFGILDSRGTLMSQVHCYRDSRAERCQDYVYSRIPKAELHKLTGNQNALFNTIMQLGALRADGKDGYFASGNTLLLLPDLLGYFLTGCKRTEYSNASVTQLFSPYVGNWSEEILNKLGVPRDLLTDIILPGTVLGAVSEDVCSEVNAKKLDVVAVCSHDTASAVAALPTNDPNTAFISSGTWSLVGTEIDASITNEQTFVGNFAVEGGAEKRSRLLKNVMGLWLVQECKYSFERKGQNYSHAQLVELAQQAQPFRSLIDPDAPAFYMPGHMPEKIADFCRSTGQPVPETPGQFIRCIMESLALKYRWSVESLASISGKRLDTIHILGGGGQNLLLNQFTANACGRKVLVGPTEAALCGNLLMQLKAYGEIDSLAQGRQILADSFPLTQYLPQDAEQRDCQYERFLTLLV